MSGNAAERQPADSHSDARKFQRSRIPLAALLATLDGRLLTEATIRDLSLVGAQVALPTGHPIPGELYLVDLKNRVAYRARVAWWRPSAAGFAFQEAYRLDDKLPARAEFLRRLLIEAKLKEIGTLTANGYSLTDAVRTAGVTGEMYARWSGEYAQPGDLTQRLWQLEAENALLKKMLGDMVASANAQHGAQNERTTGPDFGPLRSAS